MMCAVRFTTRVCRCDSQRPRNVTQVGSDSVVRDTDHYAVLGPHMIIRSPHTLRNNNFTLNKPAIKTRKFDNIFQCCSLTKF